MHLISFYGFGLHQQVPDFDGQVVTSHHVTSIMTKLHIWYTRYNLRKETPVGGIFWFLKHWNKKITEEIYTGLDKLKLLTCTLTNFSLINSDITFSKMHVFKIWWESWNKRSIGHINSVWNSFFCQVAIQTTNLKFQVVQNKIGGPKTCNDQRIGVTK